MSWELHDPEPPEDIPWHSKILILLFMFGIFGMGALTQSIYW